MVGKFSYLNQTKLSLHTLCLSVPVYCGGQVGNRYVWQGGQTENQGGQTKSAEFYQANVCPPWREIMSAPLHHGDITAN